MPKEMIDKLPEWQLGWIAGIIDGEGCLGIGKASPGGSYYGPSVRVNNTSRIMVGLLSSVTHLGSIRKLQKKPQHKQVYQWDISAYSDVYLFLSRIIKYMAIRRPQAELLLEYCSNKITGDCDGHSYYIKITKMNLRGDKNA